MWERPGLTAEILNIVHAQPHFLHNLTVNGFFQVFTGFHKPGQSRVARRRVRGVTGQQETVLVADQYHHGLGDAGIGRETTRGAAKAQFMLHTLHGRTAHTTVTMAARPFRDLKSPIHHTSLTSQLRQHTAQVTEGKAIRSRGLGRYVAGKILTIVTWKKSMPLRW